MTGYKMMTCLKGLIYVQKEDGTIEKLVMECYPKEQKQSVDIPDAREFKALPIWDSVLKGRV